MSQTHAFMEQTMCGKTAQRPSPEDSLKLLLPYRRPGFFQIGSCFGVLAAGGHELDDRQMVAQVVTELGGIA